MNWAGEWKGEFSAVRDMDDIPVEQEANQAFRLTPHLLAHL